MARKSPQPTTITFQVDDDTLKALRKLVAALGPGMLRGRSAVIRRAIIEAAMRVDEKGDRR